MKKEEEKTPNKKRIYNGKVLIVVLLISIIIWGVTFFFSRDYIPSAISSVFTFLALLVYVYVKSKLKESNRIKSIEEAFPDFIELMSSNLRAGMTIDRALLLSSRKEFYPLDEEIAILGKDILTGKEIGRALLDLATRTKSEKILKTIRVIISGIRSGGDLATLLEETAVNMRERGFVEKRAASNVLMYLILIFFAVALGAPALFALSSVLVEILTQLLGNLPETQSTVNLPLTLTSISVSTQFILYFALFFLIATNILASMLLGLVNKGQEKAGIKYTIPLIAISVVIFFIVRVLLLRYFEDILST